MNKTIKSFGYAGQGIRSVFQSELNMKIHLMVGILVIICGFIFNISLIEWMLCLLCFGLVIGMEMMNTAIEKLVDLVSPNHHPVAGKVKDIAAGAVLICAIISVIIGLIIFLPKVWILVMTII
ncbi:MAG: diacylglycerol kinase family protein [Paludibacter sp.]